MVLTAPVSGQPDTSKLHGMTLSSVCSLSVEPRRLIQFNIEKPSITSDALHEFKFFAIHILPPTLESVKVARIFSQGARRKRNDLGEIVHAQPFKDMDPKLWRMANKLDCGMVHTLLSPSINIPLLCRAERILLCEKVEVLNVDNREIWVGEVKKIHIDKDIQHRDSGGLIYFNRKFHKLGEVIT